MPSPLLAALLLLASPPTAPDPALLSVPVLEHPDLHGAYAVPTWEQSIEVTKAQYQASHRLAAAWAEEHLGADRRDWAVVAFGLGWEMLAGWLPLGNAWAHEEGHRAVLDRRGIRSFNGVYDLDPVKGAIYVRSVRDEDLVRLKAEHPADSVRLAAAGMETGTLVNLRTERDLFFLGGRVATDWATLLANATNNVGYLWVCSDPSFDSFTKLANERDGRVIVRRDALGLDCTAWAYDLQRPDEPYEARGEHPSGRGLDRYITFSDLTYDEQKVLRTVRWLSLASLVDPFLWFEDGWEIGDARATSNLAFFLTSYGWVIDHNVFLSRERKNVLLTLHHGANGARWLPGVDVQAWRIPLAAGGGRPWHLTLGGGVWIQPAAQRWTAARAEPGARVSAALAVPVWRDLEVELAGAHKTAGWVAGVASLEAETSLRAGLAWRLH